MVKIGKEKVISWQKVSFEAKSYKNCTVCNKLTRCHTCNVCPERLLCDDCIEDGIWDSPCNGMHPYTKYGEEFPRHLDLICKKCEKKRDSKNRIIPEAI